MSKATKTPTPIPATWDQLLRDAVDKPGTLLKAYSAFHNYSVGNQLLALWQCAVRGIEPGPIGTFKHWISKERPVRKGEKAIVLLQPISFKKKEEDKKTGEEVTKTGVFFKARAAWFVLSQTDGPDVELPALPDWSGERALTNLGITRVPFEMMNGNAQGYAKGKSIAISPVAEMPHKTLAHELGHVLLGHTADNGEEFSEGSELPRNIREVEAESVAMIVVESLGLPGAEFCRGYIQNWYKSGEPIPEKNAQRIFQAANKILTAGRPNKEVEVEESEGEDE